MNKAFQECEAIFEYFHSQIRYYTTEDGWVCAWNSAGSFYDDGAALVEAFTKVSPGRKPDPNDALAVRRLNKRLREMVDDGWMERWRQGNQVDHASEAKWQYVYRPPQWLMREWKDKGGSPRKSAAQYQGVKL